MFLKPLIEVKERSEVKGWKRSSDIEMSLSKFRKLRIENQDFSFSHFERV